MLTDVIKKELKESPNDFFELKEVKKHNRRLTPQRLLRWINRGLKASRSPRAKPVHLEAVKEGGRWLTSLPAIQRFQDKTIGGLA